MRNGEITGTTDGPEPTFNHFRQESPERTFNISAGNHAPDGGSADKPDFRHGCGKSAFQFRIADFSCCATSSERARCSIHRMLNLL